MDKIEKFLLILYIFAVPFFGYSLFNYRGLPVGRPDIIVAILLILIFIPKVLIERRRIKINIGSSAVLLLVFAASLGLFNQYISDNFNIFEYLQTFSQLIIVSGVFFAISNMKINKKEIRTIIKVWIFSAFLIAFYGIYQAIARNLGLPFGFIHTTNPTLAEVTAGGTFGNYIRPSSIFVEPGHFGMYLLTPIIILSVLLLYNRSNVFSFRSKMINWIIFMVLVIGFILAFSLANYAVILAISFIFIIQTKFRGLLKLFRYGIPLLILVPLTVAGLVYIGIDFFSALERISNLWNFLTGQIDLTAVDSSFRARSARALVALQVWKDHPLIGVGLNNLQFHTASYEAPSWYPISQKVFVSSHNIWTQSLATMGIIGFMALVLVWGGSLWFVYRAMKSSVGDYKILLIASYFIIWSNILAVSTVFVNPMRWIDLAVVYLILNNKDRLTRD